MLKLAVCVWLVACGSWLWYSLDESGVTFDHAGTLLAASQDAQFDQTVTTAFKTQFGDISNAVFHIVDDACWCQKVAGTHIASVSKLARESGFSNRQVSPDTLPSDLLAYVPSWPATLVFDEQGKLRYFGPYSSGVYCSANKGLVEPFIRNTVSKLPGAVIPMDAKGCYCANKQVKAI